MKTLVACVFSIVSVLWSEGPLYAQSISTSFTLGAPYNDYVPVLTQDGAATSKLWYVDYDYDCAVTSVACYGGHPESSVNFSMPHSPTHAGQRFSAGCSGTITSDTRPPVSSTQQPSGLLTSYEYCAYGPYGELWAGSLTYIYASVKKTHCLANGSCRTAYYPVMVGGYGELTLQR